MKRNVSRRAVLQALGLGGLTAWLMPYSFLPRAARAGTPAVPTRILFLYGMGSIRDFYPPVAAPGNPAPTETSFALGPLHQPLVGRESKLVILDGIDMAVNDVAQVAAGNAHINGGTEALTAATRANASLAGGVSIDQFIAQQINAGTPVTKFPSLELAAGDGGGDVEGGPHYIAASQAISPEYDPRNAYKRVFGNFAPPDPTAAKAAMAQQSSVLDSAAKEFAALAPLLSSDDRAKLDAHASQIKDLEARLALRPAAACVPPDAKFQSDLAKFNGAGKDPLFDFDLDARLVTAAFSCDLTRVATIHLPTHYDLEPVIGYTGGMFGTSDSHDLTHKTNNSKALLWNDPDAMAMIKKVHTNQAQLFRSLIDHLDAVPETDGMTLLDHTVVLWCSQIAEGGHDVKQLPWMLAGSAGGYFKTGRYLKFARPNDTGPAHNDLFVSLANAMGVNVTTFGEPSVSKGPLAGLR